jgi:hypothetical protein
VLDLFGWQALPLPLVPVQPGRHKLWLVSLTQVLVPSALLCNTLQMGETSNALIALQDQELSMRGTRVRLVRCFEQAQSLSTAARTVRTVLAVVLSLEWQYWCLFIAV